MHYPPWAFAKDIYKPTIIVPNGQIIIGEAEEMSAVSIF